MGNKLLRISPDLSLPLDAVTATQVIYGGKGMGKTNLGSVLSEELARANLKFSYMDPLGVAWGLQHGADKSRPGIECLVLGGVHGDIPIEPTAGTIVADLVVDEPISTVVDISRHANGKMWGVGERIRFVADYSYRLYERQGEKRIPLHQIYDEAGRFVPQQIPHGSPDIARCVGAIEQLVEWGRNVATGVTLITQRSARMNKSVSELADAMIAFRTVGPNSIGAVMDWLGDHVPKERWKGLLEQLRKLPRGQALVVSPGWLELEGVVQIRMRETFDSSATPKPGHHLRAPGKATKPDLAKYQARMAETIERAKADDPRELRKQIVELQRQMQARPTAAPAKAESKEIHVIKREHLNKLRGYAGELRKAALKIEQIEEAWRHNIQEGSKRIEELIKALGAANELTATGGRVRLPNAPAKGQAVTISVSPPPRLPRPTAEGDAQLLRPQQRILDSLAAFEQIGVRHVEKGMLAAHSGASPRSSAYTNNLGRLRSLGLIDYPTDGYARLTDAGCAHLSDGVPAIASLAELHESWYRILPRPQANILRHAISIYPAAINKVQLAADIDVSASSSAYTNNLGRLRTLGAITYPASGEVRASDLMFPEALR